MARKITKNKRAAKPNSFTAKKKNALPAKRERTAPDKARKINRSEPQIHEDLIIGRNAIREALKSGRSINKILLADSAHGGSLTEIFSLAKEKHIVIQKITMEKLDQLCAGERHQGIVCYGTPVDYAELDDILAAAAAKNEDPFLILLDELEDPHNLGAILRTADAVGAHGVLIPKHRSVQLSSVVARTSVGAVEYVPVAKIGNVAQTLEELKAKGLWVVGADMDGKETYYEANMRGPIVLVIGNEGKGISRLTKNNCDFLVRIPMVGKVNSLNASNACAVLAYEIFKQRLTSQK